MHATRLDISEAVGQVHGNNDSKLRIRFLSRQYLGSTLKEQIPVYQFSVVPGSPCSDPGKLAALPSPSDPNPHFLDRISRVQKNVYKESVQIR